MMCSMSEIPYRNLVINFKCQLIFIFGYMFIVSTVAKCPMNINSLAILKHENTSSVNCKFNRKKTHM